MGLQQSSNIDPATIVDVTDVTITHRALLKAGWPPESVKKHVRDHINAIKTGCPNTPYCEKLQAIEQLKGFLSEIPVEFGSIS